VTGVFVALVAIALVTTMAAKAIVGFRVQGESMTESSGSIAPFTGVEGVTMMRWSYGVTIGATAAETFNVTQQVDQVVVQARQPSGVSNVMALVIDGTGNVHSLDQWFRPDDHQPF
jgi:formylmethanofuran:tetrahydromethanopterin formyltransferase